MSNLSSQVVQMAHRLVDELMTEIDGARAVLIATVDGFDVAQAARGAVQASRLAALVSSVAALGDAASLETQIGSMRCLVIDATAGRLMVRRIDILGTPVVVVILTDAAVLLGLVWNALAAIEKRLVQ